MKSFFKKLAFVMALAMVVTLAAPAAKTAVAADKALAIGYQNENHYTISEVHLAKIGVQEDLKFFWAPTNWKELGWKWTSSNENVVTVDEVSGMVTAVAAGTATVSVAVGTETASVEVTVAESKEELPKYNVTLGTDDKREMTEETLEIEETLDLKFFGVLDYSRDDIINGITRYNCTWTSSDQAVATVDAGTGLVTAVAPGKTVISLTVVNYKTGVQHNVQSCTIVVPEVEPEVTPVIDVVADLNKTQDTIEVKLDKDAALDLNNVEVFRVFFADDDYDGNGQLDDLNADKPYESVYVEGVTFNTTTNVWDVVTFDDFIDGVTYEVHAKEYEERFVASVGAVAEVVVLEKDGASLATEDLELDPAHVYVKLYDAKGVDVTTRKIDGISNDDPSNITYYLLDEDASEYAMTDYDEVSFYEMSVANVMATYDNNGTPVPSVKPCTIMPGNENGYSIKRVVSWSLVNPADGYVKDWSKPVHDVPAGEYGYTIATLLEDSRGNYFTTHELSASVTSTTDNEKGAKYAGKDVYFTEDEEQAFWLHGYRAEYRAMDPDKMLVEDYGDVASYEKGRARFALYLYNQFNNVEEEFIKELYSQYVNVCHPKELDRMTATTSVTIWMNTEYDEDNAGVVPSDATENAYYSLFSKKDLEVVLWDIHADTKAGANAAEANFEITLLTGATKGKEAEHELLKTLVETDFAAELNGQSDKDTRKIVIEANDFDICTKNQVKFKITETTTKTFATVTVTLKRPALDENNSAVVATIDEYLDTLGNKETYEKFVADTNGFTVEQDIYEFAKDNSIINDGYVVLLYQPDASGNNIGVENNIYVANCLNPLTTDDVVLEAGQELKIGDKILIVKGPDGKIFPSADGVYGTYKNPAYTAKTPAGYEIPETTELLGVKVETVEGFAYSASSAAAAAEAGTDPVKDVAVNRYKFNFRAQFNGNNSELIYAKNGRYTVTIKTVNSVDAEGNIKFTRSTYLTDTFNINVTNSNAQVSYAGRDMTRVEDASMTAYGFDVYTKNAVVGDNDDVKKLILAAFDFNLGGSLWNDENGNLTADDILYYTYTATPTNKQVVINQVVFAVPAEKDGKNTAAGNAYGWYRSTATVNKSLTFDYE